MATYSTDLATLTDAESGTWTEFDAPYNGAGSPALDGENFIQGLDCTSQTTGKANGLVISIVFDNGAGHTFATDEVITAWCFYAVGVNLESYVNGGWRFGIGSGTGTVNFYDIGGSDYARNPYGGWFNIAIDPTLAADYTLGGGNAGTYRYFGSVPYTLNEISKGTPSAMDAIRAGRGEISVTGTGGSFTEMAEYNDWNSTATPPGTSSTILDLGYHRLGLMQDTGGGTFLWKGLMSLGLSATSASFTDSNKSITIDDAAKTYADFNKVEINNASSVINLTNITFTALGAVAPGAFEVIDDAVVNKTGCSFNAMGTFKYLGNSTLLNCVYNATGLITTGGATFTGCAFNEPTGAVGVTAASPADAALITGSEFVSNGTGNGLEITGVAADMALTDVDFTNYSTTVDADKAIFVNIVTGTMTINISGGSGVTADTHVRTAGATVIVASSVPVTITVLDDTTGLPIATTARVTLLNDTTKAELDSAAVNGSGVYSYSYTGATPLNVSGWVREMSLSGTDYTPKDFSGEITANGFSLTIRLVPII